MIKIAEDVVMFGESFLGFKLVLQIFGLFSDFRLTCCAEKNGSGITGIFGIKHRRNWSCLSVLLLLLMPEDAVELRLKVIFR